MAEPAQPKPDSLTALFMQGSAWKVALGLLFGLVYGAASALLIVQATQAIAAGGGAWNLRSISFFFGIGLLSVVARIASVMVFSRLQQAALYKLRLNLARSILATPLRALEEAGIPRLLAALTEDIFAISEGLRVLPVMMIHLALLAGGLGYMAWLSWRYFLALAAVLAVGVLPYVLPAIRSFRLVRRAREVQDTLFHQLRALIQGIKELKLHEDRRSAFLREEMGATAGQLQKLMTRSGTLYAASSSWGTYVFFMVIGLVLVAGPLLGNPGAATVTGLVLSLLYLQQPLGTTMDSIPYYNRATTALAHSGSLGLALSATAQEPMTHVAAAALPPFEGLELVGVTHAYRREQEDTPFVLGPLNVSLRAGELVFLVGGNGSGKTTFAKLLTGLYVPESGQVRLNGAPVTEQNRDLYRMHFSAVFSDFFLFDTLLGLGGPDQASQVSHFLEQLHLQHKVKVVDGALSTTDLSQGQRKRLALLTAYLEDRPVYVFDEWAADQDPAFKDVFYLQLLPDLKRRGKAVLVISHDDRYFHLADRVLRLESGQLIDAPRPAADLKRKSS